MLLNDPAEAADDDRMLSLRQAVVAEFAVAEAVDHGFDQRLLESTRSIGIGDNFRRVFRQISGR